MADTGNLHIDDVTVVIMERDELFNAVGGLKVVVQHLAPYFPNFIIGDTGSRDGTKELLEHLSGKNYYPHIKVVHLKFRGYIQTRNTLNELVTTPYAFTVDADEQVPFDSLLALQRNLVQLPGAAGFNVNWQNIWQGTERWEAETIQPRVYKSNVARFIPVSPKNIWERLNREDWQEDVINADDIVLRHFQPSMKGHSCKFEWYNYYADHPSKAKAPSELLDFLEWKAPNPRVLLQYGINFAEIVDEYISIGLKVPEKFVRLAHEPQSA